MKDIYYVGIDPGKSGAFCILDEEEVVLHAGLFTSFSDFRDYLWVKGEDEVRVALEKVNAMPKQGVKSVWTFAENYGGWLATLELLNVKHISVTPQKWQKEICPGLPANKPPVPGESDKDKRKRLAENKRARKAAIVKTAIRRLPSLNEFIKFKKDYDIADAAMIALYAKKFF